jgi:hypothetical protein
MGLVCYLNVPEVDVDIQDTDMDAAMALSRASLRPHEERYEVYSATESSSSSGMQPAQGANATTASSSSSSMQPAQGANVTTASSSSSGMQPEQGATAATASRSSSGMQPAQGAAAATVPEMLRQWQLRRGSQFHRDVEAAPAPLPPAEPIPEPAPLKRMFGILRAGPSPDFLNKRISGHRET